MKGDPDEGGARQWKNVGSVGRYRLKKGVPEWSTNDGVFLWDPAPRSQLVGLARLASVPNGRAQVFELERVCPAFPVPPHTSILREDVVLADADFLRQGVAGNVFALDELQARRLARVVTRWNRVGREVLREWLGSDVIAAKVTLDDELDGERPGVVVLINDPTLRIVIARWARTHWRGAAAVVEAEDGAQGWDLIRESKPALVILGQFQTGMGGPAVVRSIRETPELAHTRIALVDVAQAGSDEGLEVDAIVAAPYRKVEMEQRIGALLDV